MPKSKQFLLEQIARAQRFAQAMNTDADRGRFEKAADYRSELDAAEAAKDQPSAAPTALRDPAPTDDAEGPPADRRPGCDCAGTQFD
jgi:excinuclease UvrABC nuclease subunit